MDPREPLGPGVEATIPGDLIARFYKHYSVRYNNFIAAKYVLENPTRVFYGVRDLNEGFWCYVGRPDTWCVTERVEATFPQDRVFAVYLNAGFIVYDFRAEKADARDPLCPINWEQRYRGLVWQNIS